MADHQRDLSTKKVHNLASDNRFYPCLGPPQWVETSKPNISEVLVETPHFSLETHYPALDLLSIPHVFISGPRPDKICILCWLRTYSTGGGGRISLYNAACQGCIVY
eukprot:TRINITY_DN916_c0_g1_i22.p2 TRINITY_DN916_c0_g1~~TRINITY_DN916_c0_g1_i22.p2  ORF type:complete len:107 (-),score=3.68 TRINITY_DN916_c0_g1_i22:515-835(-)